MRYTIRPNGTNGYRPSAFRNNDPSSACTAVPTNTREYPRNNLRSWDRSWDNLLGDPHGVLFRSKGDFSGEETVLLSHRGFCAVKDILDKRFAVRKSDFPAINVPRIFFVDKKEMVATFATRNVYVFSQLHVSFGTENGKSAVSPSVQSIWCKPVHTKITRSAIATNRSITKIFESGI